MADLVMVLGGSSSGKSAFAENLAREAESGYGWPVYYLATGTIWDEEFARRVALHRRRRPSTWRTIEEARDLAGVLQQYKHCPAVFLIDGIGTWLANLMYEDEKSEFYWNDLKEAQCLNKLQDCINAGVEMEGKLILVADEVGMDLLPENRQARIFQKLNGAANQILAVRADRVYWVSSGVPWCLKEGQSE